MCLVVFYSVARLFNNICTPGPGTAFCHVTLICLGVSMATVSLVAGSWQPGAANVEVSVLNDTTGPQLEVVQISPTAGDWQCVCMSAFGSNSLSVWDYSLSVFDSQGCQSACP